MRKAMTADEGEAYEERRHFIWRAGQIKRIKRSTHRRERREAREEILAEVEEARYEARVERDLED